MKDVASILAALESTPVATESSSWNAASPSDDTPSSNNNNVVRTSSQIPHLQPAPPPPAKRLPTPHPLPNPTPNHTLLPRLLPHRIAPHWNSIHARERYLQTCGANQDHAMEAIGSNSEEDHVVIEGTTAEGGGHVEVSGVGVEGEGEYMEGVEEE